MGDGENVKTEVQNEKYGKLEWVMAIVFVCLAVLTVIPIIVAAGYSFYQADDFTNARAIGVFGEDLSTLFIAALKYTKHYYLGWQGTYTSLFLQGVLSPLNGFGRIQLRLVMIFNIILFIIALLMVVNAVCRCLFDGGIRESILLFTLISVGIFGFTGWTEVFYWFTGSVQYSFPMSFCLLGIAIALRFQNLWGGVCSGILLFLSSGGSLEVAGVGCFVLLGVCLIRHMTLRVTLRDYFIFGVALSGALFNVAAPGNYVRHARIDDSGLHVGASAISAVLETMHTLEGLLLDTPLILIIFIALMIGVTINSRGRLKNRKQLLAVVAVLVMLPFVTCFPVSLGYSGAEFPNRCIFIETVVIVISLIFVSVIVGYNLSRQCICYRKEICMVSVLLLIIMPGINGSWRWTEFVPVQMWEGLADGSYKNYYDQVNSILNMAAESTDENIFIYERPEEAPCMLSFKLTEDMSHWVNLAIAEHYGKKSVQYVSEPLAIQSDGQKNIRISPHMFGGKTGYLSIYKTCDGEETEEALQLLQPLDSNILLTLPAEESGEIEVRLYEDVAGEVQIDKKEIEY